MFRATQCSSSGESIYQYIIWYVSLCVGDVLIQLILLMMSTVLLETCREVKHIKKCIKLVINMNCTEMHGQQNIKDSNQYFFVLYPLQ